MERKNKYVFSLVDTKEDIVELVNYVQTKYDISYDKFDSFVNGLWNERNMDENNQCLFLKLLDKDKANIGNNEWWGMWSSGLGSLTTTFPDSEFTSVEFLITNSK